MKTIAPAHHEYQAHYLFADGLSPWFAAASLCDDEGSRRGRLEWAGEEWEVVLKYEESGLAPPSNGVTPDGTTVEFDTIREYRINVTADDGVGKRYASFNLSPRWNRLESRDGDAVARPMWDVGDAVNVQAGAANIPFREVPTLLAKAATAVGFNSQHFAPDKIHEYSTILDAARYVRVHDDEAGPIHARDGPIARMGHLLEDDRSGYRKVVQDDTKTEGHYHTVTLGSKRVREAFDSHDLAAPREIKLYHPREPESFDEDHPLAHPKLEASYQRKRWDTSLHPLDDLDELRDELDESVLAVLNEAGLPIRTDVDGGGGGGGRDGPLQGPGDHVGDADAVDSDKSVDGGQENGDGDEGEDDDGDASLRVDGSEVFVPDAYFDAVEYDGGTHAHPLHLERLERTQTSIVVEQLADRGGFSPVEWDSLEMLVSDGGEVAPDDVADEYEWHPDSVRRALRRIDDIVERSYGTVSLRSHHVAELVTDAVEEAREDVRRAVETGARAMQAAEDELEDREAELIAWASNHGITIRERDAGMVVKMGDLSGDSWHEVAEDLYERWRRAGRDVGKLLGAETQYREYGTGKIRPMRSLKRQLNITGDDPAI